MDEKESALVNAGALDLTASFERGEATSVDVVTALLQRINEIDVPGSAVALRSVLAIAADAIEQAELADRERATGQGRSRLHGVPILIKDNIQAMGLPGTAGSTSLLGRPVLEDSPLVQRLRAGGLVVFGATNLSQWANMRSPRSTSGWSAVGGLTSNPYQLDRSAGGSSSGSGAALAARLTPLAVGTETDGSITCPASLNGVVGIKPAVGAVSSSGIAPIATSQDSAGPMARSVLDTAALYEVMTGASGVVGTVERGVGDLSVGVARNVMTGDPATDELFNVVVAKARDSGLVLKDMTVTEATDGVDRDELTVLVHEMADDLSAFLAQRGGAGPNSVAELVAFENDHRDVEMPYFGHEYLEQAAASEGRSSTLYREARARNVAWAVNECLEPALSGIDCFIAPCYSPAWKNDLVLGGSGSARWSQVTQAPAIAGWPIATVPMGLILGLPVGLSIVGRPGSEVHLLAVAHQFERMLQLEELLTPQFLPPARG